MSSFAPNETTVVGINLSGKSFLLITFGTFVSLLMLMIISAMYVNLCDEDKPAGCTNSNKQYAQAMVGLSVIFLIVVVALFIHYLPRHRKYVDVSLTDIRKAAHAD